MSRTIAVTLVLLSLVAAAPARAQIQTSGPQNYPGKSEVSIHTGIAGGLTGFTPGGFKFGFDYGYRLSDTFWLDFGFNTVIGGNSGACFFNGRHYECPGIGRGYTFEPLVGFKIKFKVTQIPLVPYIKANLTPVFIFNRGCGDDGFALGARVGGGAKYFLTKNIGLGVEITSVLGPAFFTGADSSCGNAYDSHIEFLVGLDFSVGVEFAF
jgi:hypothetical protein